jgi:hypothetical protein
VATARLLALAVAAIPNNRRRGGFSNESADRALELTTVESHHQPLSSTFIGCGRRTMADSDCAPLKTPLNR